MLTILDLKSEIAKAQHAFARSLDHYGPESVPTSIGYQSGHLDTEVKWIPALDIWAYFGVPPEGKSSPNRRYWNVFGIGVPSRMVNIVCEINPPVEGIDRRIVGGFAKGLSDEIAVIHRGRFNVYGGMTMQYFRHHYAKPYITVADGTTQAEVIVVGVIGASQFLTLMDSVVWAGNPPLDWIF